MDEERTWSNQRSTQDTPVSLEELEALVRGFEDNPVLFEVANEEDLIWLRQQFREHDPDTVPQISINQWLLPGDILARNYKNEPLSFFRRCEDGRGLLIDMRRVRRLRYGL